MDKISIILSIITIAIPLCLGFISWRNHKKMRESFKILEEIRKRNETEFLKKKDTLKYR